MNFQDSETEPTKVGSGCPLSFQKKIKNILLLHKTELFPQLFMFFRVSGRPEFPDFGLQAFSFHCLYQEHIIICEDK